MARAAEIARTSRAAESHDEWALRMWKRMDRDRSQFISGAELDCEEFHSIVRHELTPEHVSCGGATYERAQINAKRAIKFCLRKADQNDDHQLSFEEFRSFLKCLRNPQLAGGMGGANLVFALFDINGDDYLDRHEFRELYRFFIGHTPTEHDLADEWERLTLESDEEGDVHSVNRHQYLRWLRSSMNPAFQRIIPLKQPNNNRSSLTKASPGDSKSSTIRSESSDGYSAAHHGLRKTVSSTQFDKPRWNQKFNTCPNQIGTYHNNDVLPMGQRSYFSKPDSHAAMKKFYISHQGYGKHYREMDMPPPVRPTSTLWPKVLSSEGGTPLMLPGRHCPNGTMLDHATKDPSIWEDHWQTPARYCSRAGLGAGHADARPIPPRGTFSEPARTLWPPGNRPKLLQDFGELTNVDPDNDRKVASQRQARKCYQYSEPW